MMGRRFYRRMQAESARILDETGVVLHHAMQSNLTLVDEQWAALLSELLHGPRIGTSFDPLPGIRRLRGGGSYEAAWRRGVSLLQAAGVRVGIVWVAHRGHLADVGAVYRRFVELGHRGGLRVNPLYAAGLAETVEHLHLSCEQWGQLLWRLYQVWKADAHRLAIDPFRGWDALASGRPARLACSFSGSCTRGFTGIRSDGAVFSCGRSMDAGLAPFGTLGEAPLDDLLRHPARRALLNRVFWLRHTECSGCRWWVLCHGGCPNDAYLETGDPLRRTGWCEGRRFFFHRAYGDRLRAETGQEPGDAGYLFEVPTADERRASLETNEP